MKTKKQLSKLCMLLLVVLTLIGMLTFTAAADTTPVTSVKVDGDKVLNATKPYLLNTGTGYIADDGTHLGTFDLVAQFESATGTLTLKNYYGGAISTSATGDLTIKLSGNNSISHKYTGINLYGGNLTITAEDAATLDIQNIPAESFSDEADHIFGIQNNFGNGFPSAEKSGDNITITGKASVTITTTKEKSTGTANGIGAYGGISVLENANLEINSTNKYTSSTSGICSYAGSITVNTAGDLAISAYGRTGYDAGENLFQATTDVILQKVGSMTLDWTYSTFYNEATIAFDTEKFAVGTLTDDTTSATYAYKFPVDVTGGVPKIGDEIITSAPKGATVTITADDPEAGKSFDKWLVNKGTVAFADATEATTTFTMSAEAVELEATYAIAYTVTANSATSSAEVAVPGKVVTVTAHEAPKGYQFSGWQVDAVGVALSDPVSSTTTFVMVDADVEITALYSPVNYTVTVTDGTATVDDLPITEATIEDTVTIKANTPPVGKVFKAWVIESGEGTLTDATSVSTTLTDIYGNITVKATYEDALYTITVENGTSDFATAKMGDTVNITADDPEKGYAFAGWTVISGDVTLTDSTALTTQFMTGVINVVVRANYTTIDYNVAVTDGTANIDGTPITKANITQTVTLEANDPAVGKKFKAWVIEAGEGTLADATSATTTLTSVYGNITVRATYEDILYTVTVTDGISDPVTAIMGETVTITADSIAGKTFKEWQVISGGVTLANTTSATTTFAVGNENVELIAIYDYTDFTVSIKDGKGYINGSSAQITNAHVGDTIHISAVTPDDGYYFVRWNVLSGEVTLANSSADTTTFTMTAGDVELEAVYAEITYLTEIKFTVTPPAVGDVAGGVTLTPAEPEKYGYQFVLLYLDESPYPTLAPTDVFEVGSEYTLRFEVICSKGYALADDAVITVNGEETSRYDGVEVREWDFKFAKSVTVTGGKAYTSDEYETEIGEVFAGDYIHLKSEAPEGKEFVYWKITQDGYTYYAHYDDSVCVDSWDKVITCEAVFATPIDHRVEGTIPTLKVGDTPITDVTDESDLYNIVIEKWYYYNEESIKVYMLPTDTYQANVIYYCEFQIVPVDGYCIPSDTYFYINGSSHTYSGYVNGTNVKTGHADYCDLVYVTVNVTGGTLYKDGVATTDTQFLPGTVLTLVADESLYPEGEVFCEWWIHSYSWLLDYEDDRLPSMTFMVGTPSGYDYEIGIEAQYQAMTQITGDLSTYVPHPTVGGNPSYDANDKSYNNYYGEVLGWYEGETLLDPTHVFEAGKSYTVRVKITPAAGYYLCTAEYYKNRLENSFNGTDVDGVLFEYDENGEYLIFDVTVHARSYQASASVTVTAPVAGKAPDETVTKSADTYCDVAFDGWEVYDTETSSWRNMTDGELFEVGKSYRVYVDFTTNETHYIDFHDLVVRINGIEPEYYGGGTAAGGYATGSYYLEFTVAAGESFDLNVENGDATVDSTPVTEVGGGVTVTITANAPAEGKAFKEWIIVSGEGVIFADATASKTTFVMPASDVSIKAIYRNTPHDITITDGTADINFAGSGETITITADEAPDGKCFAGWECVSGGVTIADETKKITTFVMTGEAVSIKALYADKILLDKLEFTITLPTYGKTPTYVITSADSEKYTATVDHWYNTSARAEMDDEETFTYGISYSLYFNIILDEKYYIDGDTVVEISGHTAYYSSASNYPYRYASFEVPVPITVEGGKAYTSNTFETEINEMEPYNHVYLKPDVPAGKRFVKWEAVSGGVSISFPTNADRAYFYLSSSTKEPVVIRAVYDMPTVTVDGGKILVDGEEIASGSEVPIGTTVTVVANTAPEGKYFGYWSYSGISLDDSDEASVTFVIGNKDVGLSAIWYNCGSVSITDGKLFVDGTEIENNTNVAPGTVVTVVANAAPEGKYFGYWSYSGGISLADSYATTTTFTMGSSNVSLSINWRTSPTVTVTGGKLYVDGTEIASGTKVDPGTVVTIVADAPAEGKYFGGWSGGYSSLLADSKAAETTFTMGTSNVSFAATMKDSPSVSITSGKLFVDGTEIASGTKLAPGTVVTIVADAPAEGKCFNGWSGSYSSLLADKNATETTFTMGTSNVSFTANYKSYSAVPYGYFYLDFLVPYTGGKPVDDNQEGSYNKSTFTVIGYYDGTTKLTPTDSFVQGKSYTVELRIVPQTGYYFDTTNTYRIEQYYDGTRAEIVSMSANEILCRFTFVALTPITEVNVSFTLPVSGEQASFVATLPNEAPYTVNDFEWKIGDTWYESDYTAIFENGETCRAWIELLPKEGYTFSPYVDINLTFPAGYVADSDDIEVYGTECYINADYVCTPNPNKATVSVSDGEAYVYDADDPSAEEPIGTRLYLYANEPADGKVFLKWEIVSGNAVIDNPYASETSFFLTENVVIKATYADNVERTITVTGGTANKATAKAGETVTLTAATAPEGKYFHGWIVKSGGAMLAKAWETETTFIMTGEAVEIEAIFLDPITEIVLKTNTNKPTVGATAAPFTVYSVNGSTELAYLIDIWAGWYKFPTAEVDWDSDYVDVGSAPTFAEGYYAVCFETWSDVGVVRYDENCKLILQFNDGEVEAVIEDHSSNLTWFDYTAIFDLTHTHDYGEKITEVPATHTKDTLAAGMKAHYYCEGCDTYFDESKIPTTEAELVIPAPTHAYGEWIAGDANNHWKVCECGKKDMEGAHDYTDTSDMICNTCGHDRTAPHTHGNGQKVNGQSATCTAYGWKDYYKCSCGKTYTDANCTTEITDLVAWKAGDGTIPASHNYGTLIANKDANCTETGMQAHYECSVCHTLFDTNKNVKTEAELTIATNDVHNFGAWSSNGNGTHTRSCSRNAAHKDTASCAGGTATCAQKANCSTCGGAYGDFSEHQYGALIQAVEEKHTQTELTAGVAAHYHCSVCDKYFDENKTVTTLDALIGATPSHIYGDWITSDPTNHWKVCECGKKDMEGAHAYTDTSDMICNTCGYDRTAPHTHGNGQKVNGQSATCTAYGWKNYYKCSCGKTYTDANCTTEITDLVAWKAGDGTIPASHNYGTLIAKKDANCTETGMQAHYECSVCHTLFDTNKNVKTEAELTIATNDVHNFGAWASNGNGTHTRSCSRNAAHKDTASCAGGTATCTEKAICSICNTAYGTLAAHQHSTELSKNADKHWYECTCGDKKDEADHIPGASATETQPQTCTICGYVISPATGHVTHVPDNEWSSNETEHWHVCTVCDEQLDKTAHTDGDQNGKCDTCDHTMSSTSSEPVATNGDDDGLSGGAIVAIVIGSVAAAGIGGFAIFWFVIKKKSLADLGALLKAWR